MTKDEILAMEAGTCLDEIIATRIMGWQRQAEVPEGRCCPKNGHDWISPDGERWRCHACGWSFPSYSTDIAAAWEVVEKMVENGYCPAILFDDNGHWALSLDGWQNVPDGDGPQDITTTFLVEAALWADTVPLAISRASLLAVMEVDE